MISVTFFQTKEQEEYIKCLENAVSSFSQRAAQLDEFRGFPFENMKELKEFGYTSLTLSKEYGGKGGSLYDFLLGQETIATQCGPTALSIGWHVGTVLSLTEKKPWDAEVLDTFFKEIANGAIVNTAATEPKSGSPTRGARPETIAIKQGDDWVITGRKSYTTLSPILDIILVTAWVPEEEVLGTFLIHRNLPGVSFEETWDMVSMQGTGSHDLVLQNVRVPAKYFVDRAQQGKKQGDGWLLHIPACYLGIAQAARNEAVYFAKTYTPNSLSVPIRDLSNVQRTIGEIELELAEARHFLYSVAEKWEQQPENRNMLTKELGAVKLSVTNHAISIVDKAMRVVGAKSLQRTNPLQRYYRDVRAGLHNPPMDDAIITLLAKSALFE